MELGRRPDCEWSLTLTGGPSAVDPDFHPLAIEWQDIEERERRLGIPAGQPILTAPDCIDFRLGDYFRTAYRADQNSTAATYATELRTWFNFLRGREVAWDEADRRDVRAFQVWRVYDTSNPRPVSPATWNKGWEALRHLYTWAQREGVVDDNPAREEDRLRAGVPVGGHREKNAKSSRDRWLTPAEYALWRDVGLRGYRAHRGARGRLEAGLSDPRSRCRNTARNSAFTDYALTTGLRLSELGTLLLCELPDEVDTEVPLVGKGGVLRHYRVLHRTGLDRLREYIDGERRDAVARGQLLGRYDQPEPLIVGAIEQARHGQRVHLRDGRRVDVPNMPVAQRAQLMVEGAGGPEPAWLWLSDSGKPMVPKAWTDVFDAANVRVTHARADQGVVAPWVKVTPHSLRFTFALFALLAAVRAIDEDLGRTPAEPFHYRNYTQAFEEVRDLLGHRSTSTTRNSYLAPLKGLRRSPLMRDGSLAAMWDELAATTPLVGFGGTP